jgi:proline iminopeptidase
VAAGAVAPNAGDPDTSLEAHTTAHLVADIERLRVHLDVGRWVVLGLSWGSTLGLAYAQHNPERVSALVLGMVVTGTRREVEWITRVIGRFVPDAWERFRDGVAAQDRDVDLADAYVRLLEGGDPHPREQAAIDWCAWEDNTHVGVLDDEPAPELFDAPEERLAFARRHPSLAPRLLPGGRAADAGRVTIGRHPRDARPRSSRSQFTGRCALAAPPPLAGQRARHRGQGRHSGRHGMLEALRHATDRFAGSA